MPYAPEGTTKILMNDEYIKLTYAKWFLYSFGCAF
jgi:hypothetical protein